jgi:hypothetical protein
MEMSSAFGIEKLSVNNKLKKKGIGALKVKENGWIRVYVRTPLKNPVDPTNITTMKIAIKMSPKITMAGRRTAKIAFPVEI